MLKKFGILSILLLFCLTGCGAEASQTETASAAETESMSYHDGQTLWQIDRDGTFRKLSGEPCSICEDGVVYEVFGSDSIFPAGAGDQEETWGLRADGEVLYEEPYCFENSGDLQPLVAPVLLGDNIQVVGEYVYFTVARKDEAGVRLCRISKDGSDYEIFEDFLIAPGPLLSDRNTVFFRLLTEDTAVGYPGKLDQSSGDAVILAESEANVFESFWLSSGKVWWQTATEGDPLRALYSARALGGEMEEYPEFTGAKIWTVSGAKVYYQQGEDLIAWDFTAMETATYPGCLTGSRALAAVSRWGALLIDSDLEQTAWWLLDFDTGAITQVTLK